MSDEKPQCWWCLHVERVQADAALLVDGVPICRKHLAEAVEYQVEDTGGANVRPLGWEPAPKQQCCCLF